MPSMAKLFIISGLPSTGSGKDSVIEGLKGKIDFKWVITTTTRPMREGEEEGRPYHFISKEQFKKMRGQGEFIEWALVYGNYYGCTKKEIKEAFMGTKPAFLKVDWQGVKNYKKLFPETVVILITVPSLEALEMRLRSRGQDSEEVIKKRLAAAKKELASPPPYDYLVVNEEGKLNETIEKVKKIILEESLKD